VATIIENSNATVWSAIPPQSPQEALMLGAFGASDDDISSRFLLLEEILETALKLFALAGERPATHAIFVSCRILVVLLRIDAGASILGDPDGGASRIDAGASMGGDPDGVASRIDAGASMGDDPDGGASEDSGAGGCVSPPFGHSAPRAGTS